MNVATLHGGGVRLAVPAILFLSFWLGTFNGRVSLSSDICTQRILSTMADREDNVYKAKLAEQAERYDGKTRLTPLNTSLSEKSWSLPTQRPCSCQKRDGFPLGFLNSALTSTSIIYFTSICAALFTKSFLNYTALGPRAIFFVTQLIGFLHFWINSTGKGWASLNQFGAVFPNRKSVVLVSHSQLNPLRETVPAVSIAPAGQSSQSGHYAAQPVLVKVTESKSWFLIERITFLCSQKKKCIKKKSKIHFFF